RDARREPRRLVRDRARPRALDPDRRLSAEPAARALDRLHGRAHHVLVVQLRIDRIAPGRPGAAGPPLHRAHAGPVLRDRARRPHRRAKARALRAGASKLLAVASELLSSTDLARSSAFGVSGPARSSTDLARSSAFGVSGPARSLPAPAAMARFPRWRWLS